MTHSAPRTIALNITGPIAPAEVAGLCHRVCMLLEGGGAEIVVCDVSCAPADAVTVDALVRLQLAAGRHAGQVRLRDPSEDLRDLLAFMGLREVLPEMTRA